MIYMQGEILGIEYAPYTYNGNQIDVHNLIVRVQVPGSQIKGHTECLTVRISDDQHQPQILKMYKQPPEPVLASVPVNPSPYLSRGSAHLRYYTAGMPAVKPN